MILFSNTVKNEKIRRTESEIGKILNDFFSNTVKTAT